MKELRLTVNTALHDLQTKAKQADKFLGKEKEQVRFNVLLRGRLVERPELAYTVLDKITTMLMNMSTKTGYITKGNVISCVCHPKK